MCIFHKVCDIYNMCIISYLYSIIIISVLHCGVITHLSSDVVDSVDVVGFDLGLPL